jgi:hypothetical protein
MIYYIKAVRKYVKCTSKRYIFIFLHSLSNEGAVSLGVNRPGREADYSPPSSSKVKE